MEAAYKTATRNAQQLTKDLTEEEIAQMLASMTAIKDEISKVIYDHDCPSLIRNHTVSHHDLNVSVR